jgi:hypothetical protein
MISLRDPIGGACLPAAERWARTALAQAQELRAIAAVAAMAPLGRAGRCFERAVDAVVPVAAQTAPHAPVPHGVRWVAFKSTFDAIVPGGRAMPTQTDVETVTVDDVGHVGLLMSREVVARIVDVLRMPQQAAA